MHTQTLHSSVSPGGSAAPDSMAPLRTARRDVQGVQEGRSRRIGLVLGAGGAAGAAYHAGALLGVAARHRVGPTPRRRDRRYVDRQHRRIVVPRRSVDRRPRRMGVGRRTTPCPVGGTQPDRPHQCRSTTDRPTPPWRHARRTRAVAVAPSSASATQPGRAVDLAAPWRHRRCPRSSSSAACMSIGQPSRCG